MTQRIRLLVIIAFVVILIGIGLVFLVGSGDDGDSATETTEDEIRGTIEVPEGEEEEVLPTQEPVVLTEIVVALQNLARGAEIPPDAVALRPWPIEAVPVNALTNPEELVGQRARVDIFQEQPILFSMVVPDLSQLGSVGSDLSASLPPGTRAVAMPIDRLTSVAYGLQRGDRVDVIISLLFVEIDEEFQTILPNQLNLYTINDDGAVTILSGVQGRFELVPAPPNTAGISSLPIVVEPNEVPRPRLSTQLTIQNALVMGMGDFPADGRLFAQPSPTPISTAEVEPSTRGAAPAAEVPTEAPVERPDIITLAVQPQEAVVLTYYVEARIPVTFALRSATDTSQVPTDPVTLDYIMNTYNIQLPTALPYGIQPAIRSIRQLVAGEVIALSADENVEE